MNIGVRKIRTQDFGGPSRTQDLNSKTQDSRGPRTPGDTRPMWTKDPSGLKTLRDPGP